MQSPTPPSASAAPPSTKTDSNRPISESSGLPESPRLPWNRYLTYFALAIVGCGVDLWTKHVVFAWRGLPNPWRVAAAPHKKWPIWDNFLAIETQLNHGAVFGMGQGKSWLFASLSVVAVVAIVIWLFGAKAARDRLLTVTLGLITGGILGNLYDRLGLWQVVGQGEPIYAVRDWILIEYGGLSLPVLGSRWPNFNIADSLLVCGAALLVWHSFRQPQDAGRSAKP